MSINLQKKKTAVAATLTLFLVFYITLPGCASAPSIAARDYYVPLAPTAEQAQTCREIMNALEQGHYEHRLIDDPLSAALLDQYLADLDPGRSYFYEKDIREFETYRNRLDDALKADNLDPAFTIYNRYQERLVDRLVFALRLIERRLQDTDFGRNETIETDRKNALWPQDTGAMNDLWRRRLKSAALNLKLADKPMDETVRILKQRFTAQLNQARQITSDDVFQTYMNSLTRSYDPHTDYLAPRVSENFNISMSLSLEGIGAVLQNENEYTKVVSLVPGGPADAAKQLRPGDRIVGVAQGADGEVVNVVGWRLDDVVQLIRGPKETTVRLEIIPVNASDEHQTKLIAIMRNTVKLEQQAAHKKVITVRSGKQSRKIGIIDIPAFYLDFKALQAHTPDYKSTAQDVRRLLQELNAERVDGLVIDLRDNGGGSLQEATLLIGMLINQGPLVQVRYTGGGITVMTDSDPEIVYNGPLAILVNRLSASASEIVAAAIQDYRRGIIIGEQTFGKGTVQALLNLQHGQLKITQAKFYRITGESTQHKGVVPDIICPSLLDRDQIGESTLPRALACDTINPAEYRAGPDLSAALSQLQERHERRIKNDPDYQYLLATIDYLNELRGKTSVSLREETRRQEDIAAKQWRLAAENRRRAAKNLPVLTSLEELDTDNATQAKEQADEQDAALHEAENILSDFIALRRGK